MLAQPLPQTLPTTSEMLAEALRASWRAKVPTVAQSRSETRVGQLGMPAVKKDAVKEILSLIDRWGSATPKELHQAVGISRATLTRVLAQMVGKRQLESHGTTSNRIYRRATAVLKVA